MKPVFSKDVFNTAAVLLLLGKGLFVFSGCLCFS